MAKAAVANFARSGGERVELVGIQMLRGVAASLVVLHHCLEELLASTVPPTSPDWLTTFGASGVDIFFVISGFIMLHTSYPRGRPSIQPIDFVVKRVSRIYPFYWFCVLVTLALWSIGFLRKLDPTFWSINRAFFLLPTDKPIIGVSWTLVYEIYFYAIFTATLFFRSRLASTLLATGAIALMLAIGNFAADDFLSNQIVVEFCFGMFLAYAFYHYQIPISVVRYGWLVGFAILCLAPLYVVHDTTNGLPPPARWAAWGIPALIVVASFLGFVSGRSRWERLLVLIGDASYAIYLTHPLVMVAYARVLKDHPRLTIISQLPFVPLVFLICLVGGTVAHMLIERPLIDLARRLARHKSAAPSALSRRLLKDD